MKKYKLWIPVLLFIAITGILPVTAQESKEPKKPAIGSQPVKAAVAEQQLSNKAPEEVLQVARAGFPIDLEPANIPPEWGVTRESLLSASLGEPFHMYRITLESLRNYRKGDTVASLVTARDMWHFPVIIGYKTKLRLMVGKRTKDSDWEVAGFGAGLFEKELNELIPQWPEAKGYNLIFIDGGYGVFFTVPEKDSYNLTLIPFLPYMSGHTPYPNLDTIDNVVKWLKPELEETLEMDSKLTKKIPVR